MFMVPSDCCQARGDLETCLCKQKPSEKKSKHVKCFLCLFQREFFPFPLPTPSSALPVLPASLRVRVWMEGRVQDGELDAVRKQRLIIS